MSLTKSVAMHIHQQKKREKKEKEDMQHHFYMYVRSTHTYIYIYIYMGLNIGPINIGEEHMYIQYTYVVVHCESIGHPSVETSAKVGETP